MKALIKRILKYSVKSLVVLVFSVIAGLLLYYQYLYEPVPLPQTSAAATILTESSEKQEHPVLLPVPKKVIWNTGRYNLSSNVKIQAAEADLEMLKKIWHQRIQADTASSKAGSLVRFVKDDNLGEQEYRLSVTAGAITITYHTMQGAYYALGTLNQIVQQAPAALPCVEIADQPDLKTRGAMIDVSRGKVPKLETLYELVDRLADLKYNQLQLYVEGFSFAYPSFRRFWEKTETPLLPEEIKLLDAYCRDRFIELVPNQNALGHMQDWLKQDELKDLAECPEGYMLLGLFKVKTTLSPTDPRSLELVKQMSEDLLPNFTSNQFNANLDEPFELGKSKQRPIKDHTIVARLYLNYVKKLNSYVNSKNKKMMMWADVVSRSPEVIGEIPKNIKLLEWRYEAIQPFDKICQKYQQAGMQYMVCPGTSSWSSYTGRTDNMMRNIENATGSAVKYGADGMLITDWGDTPHLQYLTTSYAGLAYGGALSWNANSRGSVPLDDYLGRLVFLDDQNRFGKLVLDLGRYNQFEEFPMMSMTTTALALRVGMMDPVMFNAVKDRLRRGIFELGGQDRETGEAMQKIFENPKPYQSTSILQYVHALDTALSKLSLRRTDHALIHDEYANAIRMIKVSTLLKHYMLYHLEQKREENLAKLGEMKSLCATIMKEHEKLWLARNKRSGLVASMEQFVKLNADVDKQIALLNGNVFSRWANRTMEKLIASATALYLK